MDVIEAGHLNYCTILKFDRHISSSAVEVPGKIQSDRLILDTNLSSVTQLLDFSLNVFVRQLGMKKYEDKISIVCQNHISCAPNVVNFFSVISPTNGIDFLMPSC